MGNDNSINEFWALDFLKGFLKFFAGLIILAGLILSIIVFSKFGSYVEQDEFLISCIPTIIGIFLSLILIMFVQFINLFMKIEKNTQNKEILKALIEIKNQSNNNTDNPENISKVNKVMVKDPIYMDLDKHNLIGVSFIECNKCGRRNYVKTLETFNCQQCDADIKNGKRYSM